VVRILTFEILPADISADIVHGDLKPENILIVKDSNGAYVAKVADFGWSCFDGIGNGKVYPPKSTPWYAPEWHPRGFFIKNAKRLDIFSLGMVCLWVLLEHTNSQFTSSIINGPFENISVPSLKTQLEVLEIWKSQGRLPILAEHILRDIDVLNEKDKGSLRLFFSRALQHETSNRALDILQLVLDLEDHG
jgi:serine/threonine protein kinase